MAGQRFTTRLRRSTLIVAGFLTLFVLTLALTSRAEAYVYWTNPSEWNYQNPEATVPGTIGRANLDGTGVDTSFITGAGNPLFNDRNPDGVAVNSTHVYWTSSNWLNNTARIGRANLDGTAPDPRFIDGVSATSAPGVAVDDAHVYWVSRFADEDVNGDFIPGTGAIGRANLDGTGVDENFITGLEWPGDAVAVDGSHIYWTRVSDPATFGSPARIGRANLDGTGVDEDFITGGGTLAVNDTHIWWAWSQRVNSGIERARLDGTGVEDVIGVSLELDDSREAVTGGIAVDDTHLYWGNGYGIGRARLEGTRVKHDFITGIAQAGGLAVDGLGPPPASGFGFGKVKKNKRKGTAKLTVKVPGSGDLQLAKNAKLKGKHKWANAAGRDKLPVRPRRKAKQKLAARGKVKVRAEVTFTPDGGERNTQSKRIKLIKR